MGDMLKERSEIIFVILKGWNERFNIEGMADFFDK
jgi:hypothetical protein